MADGTLRLVYTGALTPIYELDVVVRAVASMARSRPSLPVMATFYGRGDTLPTLQALAADLDIADRVTFGGRIPIEDVPRAVAEGDIAVAPTRLDPFTGMSMSTKVLEGAAMDKPVVASRLPTVERYFASDTLSIYESGDPESLAATILKLVDDAPGREARVEKTLQRLDALSWTRQGQAFLEVVDRLTARPHPAKPSQRGPV
jgi:glycosyltransferase involved in cell wall biosynthesis